MGTRPLVVVDTNVLLNLMTPVVDSRSIAPTGGDPFKTVLSVYEIHVPSSVIGEISAATGQDDLLGTTAEAVVTALHHLTTHDVTDEVNQLGMYGLDQGESHGVWLANELDADMFVTDEFNLTNYLLISLALSDRNILFTTPHVLCSLAAQNILDSRYVAALLSYYVETKHWDQPYIDSLRDKYL